MQRRIITIPVTTVLWLASMCEPAAAESAQADRPKKPAPVAVAAKVVAASPESERHLEIQLDIADGAEIFAQRDHAFHSPLQITLLDAQRRPIQSNIKYPKPKVVPLERDLGGDYQVYSGNQKINATFPVDKTPKFINVFFSGYTHSY